MVEVSPTLKPDDPKFQQLYALHQQQQQSRLSNSDFLQKLFNENFAKQQSKNCSKFRTILTSIQTLTYSQFSEQYLSLMNSLSPFGNLNLLFAQQAASQLNFPTLPQPNFLFSALATNNADEKSQAARLPQFNLPFPQTTTSAHHS